MKAIHLVFVGLLIAGFALTEPAAAHESRPAYLGITETAPERYTVLWRTPVLSGMPLPVVLKMPEAAVPVGEAVIQRLSDSLVERRVIDASASGLAGQRVDFVGLQGTITDVLVRIQYLNGGLVTVLVHPRQPWIDIPGEQSALAIMLAYIKHGIEHILLGYDHLLFVFALVLIVRSTRTLVWTITAFTLAHSITLALAALGVVNISIAPVEAAIALSILLLAHEIGRLNRWKAANVVTDVDTGEVSKGYPLSARWPWAVAFLFGLLHGFGFASALTAIGLPRDDLPLALLAFNIGVELGQLFFVALVLLLLRFARSIPLPQRTKTAVPVLANYVIGVLAAYWFIQRLSQF
jgi:hypothetical protein